MFEAAAPNQYEQKFQIDIRGLSTFFNGNIKATDFDKSGKEKVYQEMLKV